MVLDQTDMSESPREWFKSLYSSQAPSPSHGICLSGAGLWEQACQGSQVTQYALKSIPSISHIRTSLGPLQSQLSHIVLISTLSIKRNPNGLAHLVTPGPIPGCYKPMNWLLWGQMPGLTLLTEDQGTTVLFEIPLSTKLHLSFKR